MAVTEDDKRRFEEDAEALFVANEEGNPFDSLEEAESQLEASDRPFIMFRYHQFLPNREGVEKQRVRTAILYKNGDGKIALIDPEPGDIHPVRLILLTLTNLFFPGGESPFTADDEIFNVIRDALEAADIDRRLFDGGGNQLG